MQYAHQNPYLSVVVACRDEDPLERVQAFVKRWTGQAERYGVQSEVIETSAADRNAAIRRARGAFVLVTNAGVAFSDEVMQFLAAQKLETGRLYRIDRHDVTDVPDRAHVTRVLAREGAFAVTADGFRSNAEQDIAPVESGIHFGSGWFPAEQTAGGAPFRWVDNDAEVFLRMPGGARFARLEVEPGPGIGEMPADLQVIDSSGAKVAGWKLDGRITVELAVPPPARAGEVQTFRLRVPQGGLALADDPRILNLRVFRCDWADCADSPAAPASALSVIRRNRPILARLMGGRRCGMDLFRSAIRALMARGRDIVARGAEFRFGRGWYELEESGGERFRWAGQDAEVLLRIDRENYRLVLLVEPGPGAGSGPCVLHIRNGAGEKIATAEINGLTCLRVPLALPRGATTTLILTVEGGGLPVAGDARIMDFRVFAACGEPGDPGPAASIDIHDCWSALRVRTQPAQVHPRSPVLELGKPPFLHGNGCGSFLLMAREHWRDLRGFAELDPSIADADALLCYTAHYAGAREEVLRDPLRIYQIAADGAAVRTSSELAELITEMRALGLPFILNSRGWREPIAVPGENDAPYLSVVIAARNDNHGGNMLGRMQAFFTAWLEQSERYGLRSEIVVVEWNPLPGCPRLIESLQWSSGNRARRVRFIEVPAELHRRFPNPDTIPLHQMIAKNVGIRRARGEFVLATNLDIVLSAELMRFLADRRLEPRRMYRLDRCDVSSAIPAQASVDELLEFCRSHTLRVFTGEGSFDFGPCGLRELEPEDIVAADAGIRFGAGWYGSEVYDGERFRWVAHEAEIVFQKGMAGGRLSIAVDTGPSAGGAGVGIEIVDTAGAILASATVKGRCDLLIGIADRISAGFRLRVLGGGVALTRDLRMLNLRVFNLRWEAGGSDRILEAAPVGPTVDWDSFLQAASPLAARMRNPAYLHTNACGDFTLMARDDWFSVRGYPEFPIWPMHIDALLCYAAHHADVREVVLREPMRMFHIEHLTGAGWTPEGEKERLARIAAKGVKSLEYRDVERWVDCMRRFNAPMIFPRRDWGLATEVLPETVL